MSKRLYNIFILNLIYNRLLYDYLDGFNDKYLSFMLKDL